MSLESAHPRDNADRYRAASRYRVSVQELLIRLYELVAEREDLAELAELKTPRRVWGLLVGSSFSLWRAAFHVDEERDWEAILVNAKGTLERLIEDNSFGYGDEKRQRVWMVGYYLNSAKYRLMDAARDMELKRELTKDLEAMTARADPNAYWQAAYLVADELCARLEEAIARCREPSVPS